VKDILQKVEYKLLFLKMKSKIQNSDFYIVVFTTLLYNIWFYSLLCCTASFNDLFVFHNALAE